MVTLNELVDYTNGLLEADSFRDYCPNGLQVEGRAEVQTLVSGVTAASLLALGVYGPSLWLTFGLNLLALQCSLNALDSLTGLIRISSGPFMARTDAQSMAALTLSMQATRSIAGIVIPVRMTSPVWTQLRRRNSAGSIPIFSASWSMICSMPQ